MRLLCAPAQVASVCCAALDTPDYGGLLEPRNMKLIVENYQLKELKGMHSTVDINPEAAQQHN